MILMASWVHTNMPVRLVSTTFFQVSSGSSSIGTAGAPMPALLNRRSSRPNSFFTRANSALIDSGSLTSVGTESGLGVAGLLRGFVELVGAAAGQHDGVAVLGERQRHRLADAGARARHHRDLLHSHVILRTYTVGGILRPAGDCCNAQCVQSPLVRLVICFNSAASGDVRKRATARQRGWCHLVGGSDEAT